MLEINKLWFIVHLINFIILIVLLNYILFRPLLGLLTQRHDHVKGSLDSAKAMNEEREAQLQQVEAKLTETRTKARTVFEGLGKEGLAQQKEHVDMAQKDAAEINRRATEDLRKEAKRAQDSLRKEVETFARMIVDKMVGA